MSEVLTTESVDRADRLGFWREVICAVYVELDAEPVTVDDFSGSISLQRWGEHVRLSRVTSDGQVVTRSPDSQSADCLLSLQVSGTGRVTQAGRTALLQPGDLALYDATAPYELAFDDPFSQLVLQFNRDAFIARNVHIESAVARTCSGRSGLGAITGSFLNSLCAHEDDVSRANRTRLGEQAMDFAAIALADVAGHTPADHAVRSFDRQRILDHVDRHLHHHDLSVASIAQAFGVSSRTLQKLFAEEEIQLGTHIRHARVERAKRMLADPLRQHQTISRIAADVGFTSAGSFSKVFRATCGCTPSEYRSR